MKPVIKLDSKRACEENGYSASTVKYLSQRDEMRPGALSQTNRAHLVRAYQLLQSNTPYALQYRNCVFRYWMISSNRIGYLLAQLE